MARSNIYVTFGYVLLILTVLAGIGVAIYYIVKGFTSRTVTIDNVQMAMGDWSSGPFQTSFLKFNITLNGECVQDCTPKLINLNINGNEVNNPNFYSIVSTSPLNWYASVVIPGEVNHLGTVAISVSIGKDIGGFYGNV